VATARVASRSKAPEDPTNNLLPLEKQKNDRIMDVWMQNGQTEEEKTQRKHNRKK
jgi:hypothetical protein